MNIQRFLPLCKVCSKRIPAVNTTAHRTITWLHRPSNQINFASPTTIYYVIVHKSSSFSESSTVRNEAIPKADSLFDRIVDKFKFIGIQKSRLNALGYTLYESIADKINYAEFFEEYSLPDTFYSWFAVTELHVWMLSVRCMAEGEEGQFLRNRVIHALWADVGARVKHLGASNPTVTRVQVNELCEQFQAALIAYDEGLQSSDTVLAGAIWRRLYQHGEVDPEDLDSLVKYIRKHICLLDSVSKEQLFSQKSILWNSEK